ncbi:phosphate acetyltransferase [Bacteroidia bacterium]|nr:phosphate acetyltransferase [Bacteroidia bacterium]
MDLIQDIVARAKANKQRIVLPEGTEERTLRAADQLTADVVADIILIGNPSEIKELAKKYNLTNIEKTTIIDPFNHAKKEKYAQLLADLRKSKGMTIEQARELTENPLYLGCLMIKNDDADGEIAGAQNTTGNVLRPALQIIKTRPGISVVSGAFLMFVQNKSYGDNGILVFADCAVMPNPTAQELAEIAVATAHTTQAIVGIEPRVAMLSFSTKGSAQHELVDKVVEATRIAKEMAPDLQIDGELQADAAIVPSVGRSKAPGSPVAGNANVLIFPNLECGNIAYKLVQRLGNAEAVGPILQGMAAPVNDLSRGCSVDDIYKMVAICANQAIGNKKAK